MSKCFETKKSKNLNKRNKNKLWLRWTEKLEIIQAEFWKQDHMVWMEWSEQEGQDLTLKISIQQNLKIDSVVSVGQLHVYAFCGCVWEGLLLGWKIQLMNQLK